MDKPYFDKLRFNHDKFKEKSIWWLQDNGFIVESFGYEDVLDKDAANILRSDESPTSMEIRHRADTKVSKNGFECLIDWKAQFKKRDCNSGTIPNLAIDAFPFFYDYKLMEKGNLVLIAYYDIFYGVEKGFFLDSDWCPWQVWYPMINGQFVKPQQCKFIKERFDEIGRQMEPERKIKRINVKVNGGSGEPYIVIPGTTIEKQQNWKHLLMLNTRQIGLDELFWKR